MVESESVSTIHSLSQGSFVPIPDFLAHGQFRSQSIVEKYHSSDCSGYTFAALMRDLVSSFHAGSE